jgi:hypothetical protein
VALAHDIITEHVYHPSASPVEQPTQSVHRITEKAAPNPFPTRKPVSAEQPPIAQPQANSVELAFTTIVQEIETPASLPHPQLAATKRTERAPVEPESVRRGEKAQVQQTLAWDTSVADPVSENVIQPKPVVVSQQAVEAVQAREERNVRVSIGRLEVKVIPPASAPKVAPPVPSSESGLADYLRRRGGGEG